MVKCITLSSLCKVFSNEEPVCKPLSSMSMLKNERASFQVAVFSDRDEEVRISVESELFCGYINIYAVEEIHGDVVCFEKHDDYFLRDTPGEYPDLLKPVENGSLTLKAGKWQSIWLELDPRGEAKAGDYSVAVSVASGDGVYSSTKINVEIIDAMLPEQELICTNWFYTDCLSTWYNVEVFSDEYWRITENFVRTAVRHGINFILTPLFTPPLDTQIGGERPTVQLVKVCKDGKNYSFDFANLKKWIDMCDRCGVKYFEMSHLFTQWGAKCAPKIVAEVDGKEKKIFGWKTRAGGSEYTVFLVQFAKALTGFIDDNSIRERCIFHVSDEPGKANFRTYKKRCKFISEIFSGFRIIDALSEYSFIEKKACRTPIPSNNEIEPFIGNVPELWTYYCCGQQNNYVSNRFFAMPSQRNRVLGVQMYKYKVNGFLQWGYNFWYSQYSKQRINPFEVSDAGKSFPSGDAYEVYPGENGEPLVSLRLKVFYDGIQDYMALELLESMIGYNNTVELLEEGLGRPITFSKYPHSDEWQLELREKVNKKIKKNIDMLT